MSIKKVGKVWSFRIDVGTNSRTGKRKQIYRSGFSSKKEALEEMYKLQMEVMSGTYNEPIIHLFKDFIFNWLHGTYKHEVQTTSFERAEASVRNHLIPYFKTMPIDKITTYDIDQLYAQKLQTGLANATVKVMHNILSKAFQKALKWGLIKRNPVVDATPPSIRRKGSKYGLLKKRKHF